MPYKRVIGGAVITVLVVTGPTWGQTKCPDGRWVQNKQTCQEPVRDASPSADDEYLRRKEAEKAVKQAEERAAKAAAEAAEATAKARALGVMPQQPLPATKTGQVPGPKHSPSGTSDWERLRQGCIYDVDGDVDCGAGARATRGASHSSPPPTNDLEGMRQQRK